MKNIVLGTAGHIDHGKTTLIKKITGIDTDTLPEEQKRGMTINLGFAYYTARDGSRVGIIDVPGHEKFIKNMVAGATGIDFILLVIACDDGIMPQSIEHVNICNILGIKRGIVVLTKSDMVSSDRVKEVRDSIKSTFKNTFVKNLPIVEVGFNRPESYTELKDLIDKNVEELNNRVSTTSAFRMSIDRVFSVKGFGTVVTGTGTGGSISVGDTVYLYPGKTKHKVKGIQNHGVDVESIDSGNRCALNLTNLDKDSVSRGMTISLMDTLNSSSRVDALFYGLNDFEIKNNLRIRLHLGTSEVIGRVKLLINEKNSDSSYFTQLELEEEVVTLPGDLGVVRTYSPLDTIGGVKIINSLGEKVKSSNLEYREKLRVLAFGGNRDKIYSYINSNPLVSEEKLKLQFQVSHDDILNLLENSKIVELLVSEEKRYLSTSTLEKYRDLLVNFLNKYHSENRLKSGINRSEIKNKFFRVFSSEEYRSILTYFLEKEVLKLEENILSLPDFKIKLNKEEKLLKEKIFKIYKDMNYNLVSLKNILEEIDYKSLKEENEFLEIHSHLVENGMLVNLGDDYYILRGYYLEAIKKLTEFFASNDKIKLGEYKDILNSSRKAALLILEKFDALKITKRVEDYRVKGGSYEAN